LVIPNICEAQRRGPLTAEQVSLYAQLLQMADLRSLNESLVQSGVASSSAAVRAEASRALAQLVQSSREQVLPLLRKYAAHGDSAVAANALFGLGLARDTASIAALTTAVRREASEGEAAAWALGEIGAPAASALSALLAGHLSPTVTVQLLVAESKLPSMDARAVMRYLSSKNPLILSAATGALARRHPPVAVRAMLKLANSKNSVVRAQVARMLTNAAAGDSLRDLALQALAKLSVDDYPEVRIHAFRSAATYGKIARVPFTHAVADADPNVRVAVAQAAAPVFGTDTTAWEELRGADTSFVYQRSIVASALEAGVPLPILNRWRVHRNWQYRAAFVNAWGGALDTVTAKLIGILAAQDADGRVRATAYDVLGRLDPAKRDTIVQHALQTALSDTDLLARENIPGYVRIPTAADSVALKRPVSWYEGVVREIVMPSLSGPSRGATLVTERGTIRFSFYGDEAPLTVYNFMMLAARGYYNNLRFHRVVPAFVAQDGDPRGDGNGGPGYAIRDELTRLSYNRGMVGMALSGPNTGGSQYFMTLSAQPTLDGHYPLFGRVVTGLAVMDALVEGDLIQSVTVQ